MVTRDQYYLFAKFGGFHGVTAALLVALRQAAPDAPVFASLVPLSDAAAASADAAPACLTLRNRHLSGGYVLLTLLLALSSGALHHHIGLYLFVLFGTYFGWLYLRFFQPVHVAAGAASSARGGGGSDAALRGDPRADFSFASLWPPPLQPAIERLSAPVFACCCGADAGGADAARSSSGGYTCVHAPCACTSAALR
jgi:hypothetical protein